ncbi:CsbD family protein [Anabaena subtropica]|uniref:CsbD family protein n=1 Tax=Anabaena subtropica FACHB-260 TaxID=2692884 RepID=A0ABR8CSI2_9NOST|nr:CsbD family protein [Anabaena subtropica]MBD2345314.1 CsbD family protein [Anabaena subtropica FACHB-260]
MSTEDRAKATGKNIEGKAQEAWGNITGDPQDKAEGKAKQAESEVRHGIEDVKDNVKKNLD